jgi:hypothetical protein
MLYASENIRQTIVEWLSKNFVCPDDTGKKNQQQQQQILQHTLFIYLGGP